MVVITLYSFLYKSIIIESYYFNSSTIVFTYSKYYPDNMLVKEYKPN